MRAAPSQVNFGNGEISPLLKARTDIQRYAASVDSLVNFIPTTQGAATRRPGTFFVAEVKNSFQNVELIEFKFNDVQAYIIEAGDQYFRFYRNQGRILDSGTGAIFELVTPYFHTDVAQLRFVQSADVLFIFHPDYAPRKLTRRDHDDWTIEEMDFFDGPYLPTNETAHTLSCNPATVGTNRTLTLSNIAGLNDGQGFLSTDVGRLFRLQHGSVIGFCEVTLFLSATQVRVTVVQAFSSTAATTNWRAGLWSATTGFPSAATFHEGRMFFNGGGGDPQGIYASVVDDFENMQPTEFDGTVADDLAVSLTINTNDVNIARSLISDEKGLLTLTDGGEHLVDGGGGGAKITPTSIRSRQQTSYGCSNIQAIRANDSILFVQRFGRKVREARFDFYTDKFRADDLSLLAEHITVSGIKKIIFQSEKQPLMWAVLNDGSLASLTYDRDEQQLRAGWARHVFGGQSTDGGAKPLVKTCATIPSTSSPYNEVWYVVQRLINGSVKQYIELLTDIWETGFERDTAFFVDAGLSRGDFKTITSITKANPLNVLAIGHGFSTGNTVSIDGVQGMTAVNHRTFTVTVVSADSFTLDGIDGLSDEFEFYSSGGRVIRHGTVVSGLTHLAGETVDFFGDCMFQQVEVNSSGIATLPSSVGFLTVGLHYDSDMKLLRMDAGAADGTAQSKLRYTNAVDIFVTETRGLKVGFDFGDDLNDTQFRDADDPPNFGPDLFDGFVETLLNGTYDKENQLCLRISDAFPGTILGVYPKIKTEDNA